MDAARSGLVPGDAAALIRRRLRNHLASGASRVAGGPGRAAAVDREAPEESRISTGSDTFGWAGRCSTQSVTGADSRWSDVAGRLGGEVIRTSEGRIVRIDGPTTTMPLDRGRLALLPGGPPSDAPLLCLDTETTGLGSAAGTIVFLVGLGWWERDGFRQAQLLLPDHPEERAFLTALAAFVPPGGWLVTYNGRGFDWPLLVTRFRLARRTPPVHAGHLDLLSLVRRVFRHRLPDGRLRTVEQELLGLQRHGDVEGWEIPGRYLAFLRTGIPDGLAEVARHNDEDVRSLARLLSIADARLCDRTERRSLHPGDLLGLARAYRVEGRVHEALDCLDALAACEQRAAPSTSGSSLARQSFAETGAVERARLLRRAGFRDESLAAWEAIADRRSRMAAVAWIEIAKAREHDRRDLRGALAATDTAASIAERSRALGRPLVLLEADVAHRRRRLRRRLGVSRAA